MMITAEQTNKNPIECMRHEIPKDEKEVNL